MVVSVSLVRVRRGFVAAVISVVRKKIVFVVGLNKKYKQSADGVLALRKDVKIIKRNKNIELWDWCSWGTRGWFVFERGGESM